MAKFNERLRLLRNERNLSQQKIADKLGISKSSINMYERGEREPGIETLEALADLFNVDLDYLLGKSDYPNKSLFFADKNHTFTEEERGALSLYRRLDRDDRAEIRGEMKHMLKAPKYGMIIPVAARGGGVSEVKLTPEQVAEMQKVIEEEYPELLEDD